MKNKYALLLDNLFPSDISNSLIKEIISHPNVDITIFTIIKENTIPCPCPIFSISDYFNFKGISIITSPKTMDKNIAYPVNGIRIVIGHGDESEIIYVPEFKIDLIEEAVNGYNENKKNYNN